MAHVYLCLYLCEPWEVIFLPVYITTSYLLTYNDPVESTVDLFVVDPWRLRQAHLLLGHAQSTEEI